MQGIYGGVPESAAPQQEEPQMPAYDQQPPQSAQPAPQQDAYEEYDFMMDMWADILEDGESQTDTFTIVTTGATPIKMNDDEIVLKVTGLAGRYLEKNRIPMEALIEKYAGSHLDMILRRDDEGMKNKDVYGTASKIGDILGTNVDVK